MLDSIQVAMTGLLGFSKGLRVIANNTANLNTPGYKSTTLQFKDLVNPGPSRGEAATYQGQGLATAGTLLDFRQGELRSTGQAFDLGVEGEGLFVLRDADGQTRYTRAGQFEFDEDGVFINRIDGSKVMGVDAGGNRGEIGIAGLRTAPGNPSAVLRFTGNLSSTTASQTVSPVKVYDALGNEHTLSLRLTNTGATAPGSWKLELLEGTTTVGEQQMTFEDGKPKADSQQLSLRYQPAGAAAQQLTLDFSSDVTSFASGNLSTLAMSTQDGSAPANLSQLSFDEKGVLVASYANGSTAQGPRLLMARFSTPQAVESVGSNQFAEAQGLSWETGFAGEGGFGHLRAGVLEFSNVDLSREFSDLVVMQRGYQASSQVISTANDMVQELFQMKKA